MGFPEPVDAVVGATRDVGIAFSEPIQVLASEFLLHFVLTLERGVSDNAFGLGPWREQGIGTKFASRLSSGRLGWKVVLGRARSVLRLSSRASSRASVSVTLASSIAKGGWSIPKNWRVLTGDPKPLFLESSTGSSVQISVSSSLLAHFPKRDIEEVPASACWVEDAKPFQRGTDGEEFLQWVRLFEPRAKRARRWAVRPSNVGLACKMRAMGMALFLSMLD